MGGPVPFREDGWRENGVAIDAEDHSDGSPLEGEDEWRATVAVQAPRRAGGPAATLCSDAGCFCRRARDVLPQMFFVF